MSKARIGIDLGGTKTEIAALGEGGAMLLRRRVPTPADYDAIIATIVDLVRAAFSELGAETSVGVGIPGVISPATGLVKNANSVVLNGHPLDRDLSAALGRTVRVQNDANCLALSEATDGAAAAARVVFAVILGTGCGGGVVVDRRLVEGRHRIAGEWGHNPLPWPLPEELPGPACWCGQHNCLETRLSGPALVADYDGSVRGRAGATDAATLPARAAAGDTRASAALDRHADRLARGLAQIVNLLDPDAIVLAGGVSNMMHLYEQIPVLLGRHVFSDVCTTPILRAMHGDSSGVRGAAWLWSDGD